MVDQIIFLVNKWKIDKLGRLGFRSLGNINSKANSEWENTYLVFKHVRSD